MERGLYAAATGMLAQQTMQEVLAQNIANAATVAYKQDQPTFRTIQTLAIRRMTGASDRGPQIGELGAGVNPDKTYIDWQQGPLAQTGAPLDASLGQNQFFAVQSGANVRYTRAGNFQIDGTGNLVTPNGDRVLDRTNRPINVAGRTQISLDARGNVLADRQPIAQIQIVDANVAQMEKEGETRYRPNGANAVRPAAAPLVRPGTLEQSNANTVMGLVRLITVSRAFEMAQRAVTTQDELLRQATTEVGKV